MVRKLRHGVFWWFVVSVTARFPQPGTSHFNNTHRIKSCPSYMWCDKSWNLRLWWWYLVNQHTTYLNIYFWWILCTFKCEILPTGDWWHVTHIYQTNTFLPFINGMWFALSHCGYWKIDIFIFTHFGYNCHIFTNWHNFSTTTHYNMRVTFIRWLLYVQ